jgi:hypothetical protein
VGLQEIQFLRPENDERVNSQTLQKLSLPIFHKVGITDAIWAEILITTPKRLIVTCEWSGIYAFDWNRGKVFTKSILSDKKGW